MIIDFKQQTAVVTGGAGGIGAACVKNLLESNAEVAVLDISEEAVRHTKEELANAFDKVLCSWKITDTEEQKQVWARIEISLEKGFEDLAA